MRRLKQYLPNHVIKNLYYSLIHSHLQYQLLNWGYDSEKMEKLQKRAMRILNSAHHLSHTQPLFKKSRVLQLKDLHVLSLIKLYKRHLNRDLPSYFMNVINFNKNSDNHPATRPFETRFRFKLMSAKPHNEFARKVLRNSIPKIINSLPEPHYECLISSSLNAVTSLYKRSILDSYSDMMICNDPTCYVCNL